MIDAPATTQRILVIEDDRNVAEVVSRYLTIEGFEVEVSSDGTDGLRTALATSPDLVVLDVMLPGLSGVEVLRALRRSTPVPVILLTALGSETDRVGGLELGADDYVAKPFSPRELTARVKAVLRRAHGPLETPVGPTRMQSGELSVDTTTRQTRCAGRAVELTAREFDLLVHFMRNPMRAFRRDELLAEVWGFSYGDTSTVTVHVSRLRDKLERDPDAPRYIQTVRSIGYRFVGVES